MPAPPEDVTPEELFLALTEPRPSAVMDWPVKAEARPKDRPAKVRVFVLPALEHERAVITAKAKLKERYKLKDEDLRDQAMKAVIGDAAAREIIAASCHRASPIAGTEGDVGGPAYARCFRDSDHVNQLSTHEIAVLFRAYELVQEKFGPYEGGSMGRDEVDLWIKRLQEGGSEFPLLSMPLPQLVAFSYSLAARMCSLSALLASQSESLPNTLMSDLRAFWVDISSFGQPAAEVEPDGSESSAEFDDPVLSADEPLDVEHAKDLARRFGG